MKYIEQIVADTNTFGGCYLGNANIMGEACILKRIKKIQKFVKDNGLDDIYFYHDDKANEFYTVAAHCAH